MHVHKCLCLQQVGANPPMLSVHGHAGSGAAHSHGTYTLGCLLCACSWGSTHAAWCLMARHATGAPPTLTVRVVWNGLRRSGASMQRQVVLHVACEQQHTCPSSTGLEPMCMRACVCIWICGPGLRALHHVPVQPTVSVLGQLHVRARLRWTHVCVLCSRVLQVGNRGGGNCGLVNHFWRAAM